MIWTSFASCESIAGVGGFERALCGNNSGFMVSSAARRRKRKKEKIREDVIRHEGRRSRKNVAAIFLRPEVVEIGNCASRDAHPDIPFALFFSFSLSLSLSLFFLFFLQEVKDISRGGFGSFCHHSSFLEHLLATAGDAVELPHRIPPFVIAATRRLPVAIVTRSFCTFGRK